MQYAFSLKRKLTHADAVHVLGAIQFYLQNTDVCRSLADMSANNQAQGLILSLRESACHAAYGGKS